MKWLLAALGLALASCGGGHSAPSHPAPPAPATDAGVVAPDEPPTAAECDRLIAHAVELGMADQRAHKPPERVPTAEQQAQVRARLHEAYAGACRQMSHDALACALAATTTAALEGCDQDSPSSSTSNSSVAPGGMTPAAPRSP